MSISNIQSAAVTNNNINVHHHHFQEDINVLRQLCNDASVVMRRAAAERITSLLFIKNEYFMAKYKKSLISSFANHVNPS